MILGVTSFALIRLGVVPEAVELLRIILWILVTLTYIALWLAFGLLLSVGIRRAATSALGRVRDVAAAVVLRRTDRLADQWRRRATHSDVW
jgi:hypothetical protein